MAMTMAPPEYRDRLRLAALGAYAILDTPPEEQFDRLTRLAAKICDMPMAAISLVDESRQWFKSVYGFDVRETDIAASFCKYTICTQGPFVVEDASRHPLFADNPLVTGNLHLRFYAGSPLVSPSGHALGALIVIDREPRTLSEEQKEDLSALADLTMIALELRRQRLFQDPLGAADADVPSASTQAQNAALNGVGNGTLNGTSDGAASGTPNGPTRGGFWELDTRAWRAGWSPRARVLLGIPDDVEPSIEDISARIVARDRMRWLTALKACLRQGVPMDLECALNTWQEEERQLRWIAVSEHAGADKGRRLIGNVQPVPARVVASPLHEANVAFLDNPGWQRHLAGLILRARDAMVVTDAAGRIQFWNEGAARLFGWSVEEAIGQGFRDLVHEEGEPFPESQSAPFPSQEEAVGEGWFQHRNGRPLQVHTHATRIVETQRDAYVFRMMTDITQQRVDQQKAYFYAFFDQLTQLPNRSLLLERIRHAQYAGRRDAGYNALIFLDLDGFKHLNDTLGHRAGDFLMRQVASRLLNTVRPNDTVARVAGDEFAVLLEGLGGAMPGAALQAEEMTERIRQALAVPFQLQKSPYAMTVTAGIALCRDGDSTPEELLKQAEMAMYQCKGDGRNKACFFDFEMQRLVRERAVLRNDLRYAALRNEFELHYQPQCGFDGEVRGLEALLRWRHPQKGLVTPAHFIGIAEESNAITLVGRWVLEAACRQQKAWQTIPGAGTLSIAVNVSAREFIQDGFVDQVRGIVQKTGADATCLKLELTESLLMKDADTAVEKMLVLKGLGLQLSLDDFGTGYSSLALLRKLPLDQIKIDQSFVRNLTGDTDDDKVVQCIIALGKSLDMHVLAEGVETSEQRRLLSEYGCDAMQGFLFSRPVPPQRLQFSRARVTVV